MVAPSRLGDSGHLNRLLATTLLATPLLIAAPAAAGTLRLAPVAQELKPSSGGFPIPSAVGLVRTSESDPHAEAVVRKVLADAGVKRVTTTDGTDPRTPVIVWLGDGDARLTRLGVRQERRRPARRGLRPGLVGLWRAAFPGRRRARPGGLCP
ncbi:hypothetical protein AB0K48_55355, partial [Nonomuraea sp. NPDC055795]